MEKVISSLFGMTHWVLLAMVIAPILLGCLTFLLQKREKLRTVLIWISAAIVLAGGILLVWLSTGSEEGLVQTWQWDVPATIGHGFRLDLLSFGLEAFVLLALLYVGFKIENGWIVFLGLIQTGFAVAAHFVGEHQDSLVLFRIDNLTRILILVTAVVGSAILIFSINYMKEHAKHAPEGAGSLGRFYFFFISFLGFMIGLVSANNFSLFSTFWEATTLCSYALIGQDGGEARRVNATRALLINSFGGVLMLAGIFLLKVNGCGEDFQSLTGAAVTVLPAMLLCMAAFTKSALFPFQSWLLGAMVAPTPVSALLHAATMVKAGVYLVMRISPHYSDYTLFMMMIAFTGALSFAGAAFLACTQSNAKKVLAYSTISNLGLVVACAGIESPLAYAAGLSIITFHAVSKGLLFLCVGRIEQKLGSRDIEKMDGMPYKMPFTTMVAMVGMMSMLLPPFGMLLSKWLAIEATIHSPFLLVFLATGSAFTVYFWAKWMGHMQIQGYHPDKPVEEISKSMKFSLGYLAILVIVTGLFTMMIFRNVFTTMAAETFLDPSQPGTDMDMLNKINALNNEQAMFPAYLVLGCLALGLILSAIFIAILVKNRNIRPPYLCGENAITIEEELNPEKNKLGLRSYDFYSVGGKVEHAVFSSYYFKNYINENRVSKYLNWLSWLSMIVLIGCVVAAITIK
ncbi:MAG: NADH-quinone oxidoreductase subunit L [Lentisphaerae bacterium]|nr:NADH-quinone oxidoreductase subunit L [Lentisphaerota bacterium]